MFLRRRSWVLLLFALGAVPVVAQPVEEEFVSAPPLRLERGADVLVLLDRTPSMDRFDPQRYRLEGVQKLIHGLDASYRVGVVAFDQRAEVVIPLTPLTEAGRRQLQSALNIPSSAQEPPETNVVAGIELGQRYLVANRQAPGRRQLLLLISDAPLPKTPSAQALPPLLRDAYRVCVLNDVDLGVLVLGREAGQPEVLYQKIVDATVKWRVEDAAEIPRVFAELLPQLLGYEPRFRRLRVDRSEMFSETFAVPERTERLYLDLVTEPDSEGLVPLQASCYAPDGTAIRPRYLGPGAILYEVMRPTPGTWRVNVATARPTRLVIHRYVDQGVRLEPYFPSALLINRKAELYFGVIAPDGPIERATFSAYGRTLRLVRARIRLQEEGSTEEALLPAELQDRSPRHPAYMHYLSGWRPERPGTYRLTAELILREEERLWKLAETRQVVAVADPAALPTVALISPVDRQILDYSDGAPPQIQVVAQVVRPGQGPSSPTPLGRFLPVTVTFGEELIRTDPSGEGLALRGNVRRLHGDPAFLMEPVPMQPGVYRYPPAGTQSDGIPLVERGYYEVRLVEGSTYTLDPSRSRAILRVGRPGLSPTALGLLALGALVALGGIATYVLIETGWIGRRPTPSELAAAQPADDSLVAEADVLDFIDVLSPEVYGSPLNIPSEIVVFQNGILTDHVYLEHESILGGNYIATVRRGRCYLNDAPLSGEFDLHMGVGDTFRVGPLVAEVTGIEMPVLVLQFIIRECRNAQIVNTVTRRGVFRWTVTDPLEQRVPPQVGEKRTLSFEDLEEVILFRDEGFIQEIPPDVALYHESIGTPHARLFHHVFLDGSVGYGVEALNGPVYVNNLRVAPGEQLEEFPSGSELRMGELRFRMRWNEQPYRPVLEFVAVPERKPLPLPPTTTDLAMEEAAAAAAPAAEEGLALDELFQEEGPAPGSAEEAGDELGLEALFTEEPQGGETPAEETIPAAPTQEDEFGLDQLLAETDEEMVEAASEELEPTTSAPEPEDLDLEALLSEAGPEPPTAEEETPSPEPEPQETALQESPETQEDEDARSIFRIEELLDEAPAQEEEEAPLDSLEALLVDAEEAEEEPTEAPAPEEGTDPATGLPGPTAVEERLAADWELAAENDLPLSLVIVDMEAILQDPEDPTILQVAQALQEELGELAFVGRMDVGRFAVLLPNVPLDEATEIGGLLRNRLAELLPEQNEQVRIGVSERSESETDDPIQFVQSLQTAMEEASESGHNFVVYG
ncbi:MAG: hypothetical protein KatS3mg115_2366 [Candidatus Poribacteria bacterium]|nr:MAG: hypothetical protein KatS3mg115_2366 [Candidatus Poribacteria bacterium]